MERDGGGGGGLVSLTSGTAAVMDVSGTPALRGGGGGEMGSSVGGR